MLFMVDSCMGDKKNTQDINCGGLRKDTKFYSWFTVVCVFLLSPIQLSTMNKTQYLSSDPHNLYLGRQKKYTRYKLWGSEERY